MIFKEKEMKRGRVPDFLNRPPPFLYNRSKCKLRWGDLEEGIDGHRSTTKMEINKIGTENRKYDPAKGSIV